MHSILVSLYLFSFSCFFLRAMEFVFHVIDSEEKFYHPCASETSDTDDASRGDGSGSGF